MARKIFKDKPAPPAQGRDKYIRRDSMGQAQASPYLDRSGKFSDARKGRQVAPSKKAWAERSRILGTPSLETMKTLVGSSLSRVSDARSNPTAPFYPKEVFDSQAEYDASVENVVARIKSGEVQARTPDE